MANAYKSMKSQLADALLADLETDDRMDLLKQAINISNLIKMV